MFSSIITLIKISLLTMKTIQNV